MMSSSLLLLSLPLLALAQNPSGPWPAAPSGPDAPAPGAPICGKGFTYCGYILRDHQSLPPLKPPNPPNPRLCMY